MPPAASNKPIKLVIADVDGTLVTHDKILTQRAIDSVMKMRDAGIQFAITSGRPPKGMAMLVEPLKLNEPIAAFNGGVVIKPDLKTVLQQNTLTPDAVKKVVKLILDHKLDAWIYTDKDWFVRDVKAAHVAREQWTVKFEPVVTTNSNPSWTESQKWSASATISKASPNAKKTCSKPAATVSRPLARNRTISTSHIQKPTKAKS